MKDYYAILQVSAHAEREVIDAAYRRLARKYHPDVDPGPDAADRMRDLNEAYEVLSDPGKRREYDRARGYTTGEHSRAEGQTPRAPARQHQGKDTGARKTGITQRIGRVRMLVGLATVGSAMLGVWIVLAIVGALPGGGNGGGDGGGEGIEDNETAIRATLTHLFAAANEGDWQAMYDLMSASYQARCPFDEFAELAEESEEAIAERTLSDVQDVSIFGERAEATVIVEISGGGIAGTFAFVLEDNTWRHDPPGGPNSGCQGVF